MFSDKLSIAMRLFKRFKFLIALGFQVAFVSGLFSPYSFSQTFKKPKPSPTPLFSNIPFSELKGFEKEISGVALKLFEATPKIIARTDAQAPCLLTLQQKIGTPKPLVTPTPSPSIQAYQCTRSHEVDVYSDNDNLFLGLLSADGDDWGDTFSLGLNYKKQLSKNRKFITNIESRLYTQEASSDYLPERNKALHEVKVGNADAIENLTQAYTSSDQTIYPVYFNDVTRFKGTFEKQKKNFYYQITGGYESRKTSHGSGLTSATWIQTHWHKMLDVYNFEYIPSEGQPGFVQVKDRIADYKGSYDANPEFQKISKNSFLLGGAAGVRKTILTGHCELMAEVSGLVSTEKNKVIGQNSYLKVQGDGKLHVFKMRPKHPGFTLGGNLAVIAYPQGLGEVASFSAEGKFPVGKKGSAIQPYMIFYVPRGQLPFHAINDHDAIQRLGLKLVF